MRNSAIAAKRDMLTERLVQRGQMGIDWTYLTREGSRIPNDLLWYLHEHTTGKFRIGHQYIAFEKEEDALVYKIAYPK